MIAKYNFESKIDDSIRGQVLHQDGISLGGDQLVKRLLETIIVPAFAEALGLEEEDVQLLFGPEVPRNREIRAQRVNWINRLFVPLAQAYLNNAVRRRHRRAHLPHRSRDRRSRRSSNRCRRSSTSSAGRATTTPSRSWTWSSTRRQFEGVVHDVFDELLFDYCQRIVDHEADVVLLAGLPSKLGLHPAAGADVRAAVALADRAHAQPLRRQLVSLPGREGPQPGRDRRSQEPGGRRRGDRVHGPPRHVAAVQVRDEGHRPSENTYYWGVMTDATSGIRNERILFASRPKTRPARKSPSSPPARSGCSSAAS